MRVIGVFDGGLWELISAEFAKTGQEVHQCLSPRALWNTRPERRASLIQMSVPLYANTNHKFVFQPPQKPSTTSDMFVAKFHNRLHEDAEGWTKRMLYFVLSYIPRVVNPHAKIVQQWNKFFMISCSFALFLDPLFFFLFHVEQINKCVALNWSMATTLIVLRSMNDFIYLLHILLQFRLAYFAAESRGVGPGDVVDDPKMIARNYIAGHFIIDFFVVLPLPQIIFLLILPVPDYIRTGASFAKNLIRSATLVQMIPRLCRFLHLVAGSSPTGFIFQSAWSDFVMSLLTFLLASHVVGSYWYSFGLQRVGQCFQDACGDSTIKRCMEYINCRHGDDYGRRFGNDPTWEDWMNNQNAAACFRKDGFDFGIYQIAVNLTTQKSVVTRYVYSLFWGFQQLNSLAGNQKPSYFVLEVLFTLTGLLLFALFIGSIPNFPQILDYRRRLEMSLRRRNVEMWMSHRRLPKELRSQVLNSESYNWAVTRGVNEEVVMENLPEDLQRQIRRHIFKFVEKVRIFQLMDEPVIDAICERLKMKTYIQGSKILYHNGLVDKMVFIIRGKMVSIGEDGIRSPLFEGDVCGEELLTWCLEHSSVNKDGKRIRIPGHRMLSNRVVSCLTNVEACVLRAADLEKATRPFARFLRSPRVQGAIRYESPYWRGLAAKRIQVAWRYRKKRINRADLSSPPPRN